MDNVTFEQQNDTIDIQFSSTMKATSERIHCLQRTIFLLAFLVILLFIILLATFGWQLANTGQDQDSSELPAKIKQSTDFPQNLSSLPCADWVSYNDEYCYKVFHNVGLQSFEAAEAICQANSAHLITIRYLEEQQFLNHFHFNSSQLVDGVWIGARFNEATLDYKWTDGSGLRYTNWAPEQPKNRPNYCVQMQPEMDHTGKWTSMLCSRKNAVVCQKTQPWSRASLEKAVHQLRYSLRDVQNDAQRRLAALEQNFVPIGFIYVQLPKEKSPKEIWPLMTWTDASVDYNSLFFRVEGGSSAPFGTVQEANSTYISNVAVELAPRGEINTGQLASLEPGKWSAQIITSHETGSAYGDNTWKFYTTEGETRPRNMAMRIWKRSA